MARKAGFLGEDFQELMRKNGRLLTGFAVALIIVTGITIIDNLSNWFYAPLAIIMFFLVSFLFLNAKVFIKASVAILLTLTLGGYAFKFGSLIDTTSVGGILWMTSLFALFFLNLTFSFLWPSSKSRWGLVTLTSTLSFLTTLVFSSLSLPLTLASISSSLIWLAIFLLLYRYGFGARYKLTEMPLVGLPEETSQQLAASAVTQGWGSWERVVKGRGTIVVWNDSVAFQLSTMELSQAFGNDGKKNSQLVYQGSPINPWLLELVYRLTPSRGTANADIMLILLDSNNKNGNLPRVIGVEIPDSKKRIPVGILPAKFLLGESKQGKIFEQLLQLFGDYVLGLTPKQVQHLDSHLPLEDDNTL